jgi:hypothetical protein
MRIVPSSRSRQVAASACNITDGRLAGQQQSSAEWFTSYAVIAQQVERLFCNQDVQGSIPCDGTSIGM